MRRDYFVAGLGFRLLMLVVFLLGNHYDKYNDMSEIIFYALNNMLRGENPYSVIYEIEWGAGTFYQPFNYGPATLFFLLPAMIFPFWYNSLWIGMFLMNNFYSYLLSEYMIKKLSLDKGLQKKSSFSKKVHKVKTNKKSGALKFQKLDPRRNRIIYFAGIIFWVIPWGTFVVTSFLVLPIYLSTLAFGNRDNPLKCSFYIMLAAMSYQLLFLFIPVYIVYHFNVDIKNLLKFGIGAIPSLLLFSIFMFWGPGGIIESMFLHTSAMGYVKCPTCAHTFDFLSVFSIPKLVYELSNGKIQIGNLSRMVLILLLGFYLFLYLIRSDLKNNSDLFIQKYLIAAVFGFILTNNYGQVHYFIIAIVPMVIHYQINNPKYRNDLPIGTGIKNWQEFERYLLIFHKLPY